jgi:putative aldouronate transport system permease protein
VDPNLYEAASIDGAGRWRRAVHVTFPALVPTIIILLILRLGHVMSEGFEKVILLYNPLTYETADVIASYVYRRGLQEANYSFGAAVGMFNSVINFIILVAANYISRKFAKESLW